MGVVNFDIIIRAHNLRCAQMKAALLSIINRCLRPSVQLFLRQPLDYEKETEYQLGVMAIDAGSQPLTGRQTVSSFTYLLVLLLKVIQTEESRDSVVVEQSCSKSVYKNSFKVKRSHARVTM